MRPFLLAALVLASPVQAADLLVVSQAAAALTELAGSTRHSRTLSLARSPAAVLAAPGGTRAYVSHPELGTVSVVDLEAWRVERELQTGGQPFGLALAGSDRLLVTDWSANTLVVVELASSEMRRIKVGGAPSAVVTDPDANLAYTIDRESDAVSVVDLHSGTVTDTIHVGRAPFAAALTADGAQLLVANVQSGDLSVVDTAAREETARIVIGGMPYGVAVDRVSGLVLVSDQEGGDLALIDLAQGSVAARIPVGDYSEGVVVLDPGGRAAVANWFSDNVTLVNLQDHTTSRIAVPAGPRMLAVVPQQAMAAP